MCRISQDGSSAGTFNILAALNYIFQTANLPPGPINISFNAAPPNTLNADPTIQQVAQLLASKGFLVVLAAGNNGVADNSPELNARRVAAIGPDGLLTNFSNFGQFIYAAPGFNVPVYSPSGAGSGSGTSFAAPRLCAAIVDVMGALPVASRPAPNAEQIIRRTAKITSQGYAVPNLQAAVKAAAGIP
jgi:hypothetical protein